MSATAIAARVGQRRRTMVTPEGLAIPFVVASRGARFLALALDLIIIVTVLLAVIIAAVLMGLSSLFAGLGPLLAVVEIGTLVALFLFHYAYFLYFELGPRGATPGKRIAGIRVAARSSQGAGAGGGRLTTEAVIARNLLRDIELFIPLIFLIQGGTNGLSGLAAIGWFGCFALLPMLNRDALRAGDIVAGTWVVEAPRGKLEGALSVTEGARGRSQATGATYRFTDADLAIYGEFELQALERVLRNDDAESLAAVARTICHKIGWEPGQGDERAFLEAYYAQFRARLERGLRFGQRKADKYAG